MRQLHGIKSRQANRQYLQVMCSLLGWLGDRDYASTHFKVDALRLDLGH